MSVDTHVHRRLGPHAERWDELVAHTPHATVFLTSWWLEATATDDTEFVIVSRDGTLIGGVALERSQRLGVDCFRFAGLPNPHGIDAVAAPGEADTVVEALRTWFAAFGLAHVRSRGRHPSESRVARSAGAHPRRRAGGCTLHPSGRRLRELPRGGDRAIAGRTSGV